LTDEKEHHVIKMTRTFKKEREAEPLWASLFYV